jgi:hypothetical protein
MRTTAPDNPTITTDLSHVVKMAQAFYLEFFLNNIQVQTPKKVKQAALRRVRPTVLGQRA